MSHVNDVCNSSLLLGAYYITLLGVSPLVIISCGVATHVATHVSQVFCSNQSPWFHLLDARVHDVMNHVSHHITQYTVATKAENARRYYPVRRYDALSDCPVSTCEFMTTTSVLSSRTKSENASIWRTLVCCLTASLAHVDPPAGDHVVVTAHHCQLAHDYVMRHPERYHVLVTAHHYGRLQRVAGKCSQCGGER